MDFRKKAIELYKSGTAACIARKCDDIMCRDGCSAKIDNLTTLLKEVYDAGTVAGTANGSSADEPKKTARRSR